MGTFSKRTRAWCAVTTIVVLVTAGAALGQYEDSPRIPLEDELLYQEPINLDSELRTGFGGIEKTMLDKEINRALILDKIMQGVQMRSESSEDPGSISETVDYLDFTRMMPGTKDPEDMVTKRFADNMKLRELRNGDNTSTRPQRRWNTKKGKGTQIICYFKLCSFRKPS